MDYELECNSGSDRNVIKTVLYECGRCQGLHPWETNKCNDAERYVDDEDYAQHHRVPVEDIAVISRPDTREEQTAEKWRLLGLSYITRRDRRELT